MTLSWLRRRRRLRREQCRSLRRRRFLHPVSQQCRSPSTTTLICFLRSPASPPVLLSSSRGIRILSFKRHSHMSRVGKRWGFNLPALKINLHLNPGKINGILGQNNGLKMVRILCFSQITWAECCNFTTFPEILQRWKD